MKLLRYGNKGFEKPAILDSNNGIRDLSSVIDDLYPHMYTRENLYTISQCKKDDLPLVQGHTRIGPPLASTGKIIGIGLNYKDHAKEAKLGIPDQIVSFMKAASALSGPYDDVILPKNAYKADWEVELAIIIGDEARYVQKHDALNYIGAFTIMNDISERAFQFECGGQWMKGKSADSFAPLGPYAVTSDEIADCQNLSLWLDLNGKNCQKGCSKDMIFSIAEIISHLSHFMTLKPGDVITTGTPSGVGWGMDPQRFLRSGDVMHLGIEGLGEQKQKVVSFEEIYGN